jgi:hypothetical protein
MAEMNPPLWLQAGTYTADKDRLLISMLVDKTTNVAGSTTTLLTGVVPPKNQLHVTSTGTMTVSVSAGMCVVPEGATSPTPGAYLCYNDGAVTVAATAADTSARKDIVVAVVKNAEAVTGASNTWELAIVAGIAGGSPTDPNNAEIATALGHDSFVKLARLNIGASATSITAAQIDDLRVFVAAPGGVHLNWGSPLQPHSPGRLAYDVVGKSLMVSDGSTWQLAYTRKEWESYFALYRGGQDYLGASQYMDTFDDWRPLIKAVADDTVMSEAVKVTRRSPSGFFKVTVEALAKAPNADVRGMLGVEVLEVGVQIREASLGEGTAVYNTSWIYSSASWIYNAGVAKKDVDLTFRVNFRKEKETGGTGSPNWTRIRLVVEPML